MDKTWSDLNKQMQNQLGKKANFQEGIQTLLTLRHALFEQITQIAQNYPAEAFAKQPYAGASGYHSKTLAYSIWHIFRIEDIVAHELIARDNQILFRGDYQKRIASPIITTGNELIGDEIAEFSEKLNIRELYHYAKEVMDSTDELLLNLPYEQLKQRFTDADRQHLRDTCCISKDENAAWLIDYWCGKDVKGLIKMPFSRHWIMHVEAMQHIKNRLCQIARKGVDPIAYCGFSCNHCFLGAWCGSCRTSYNTCSFATCSPDGKCPNAVCCQEKGLDGCYECADLMNCTKGFYVTKNDGAQAAKAQAMYIRLHGKKEYQKMQDRFHAKYTFDKTQEILGQDMEEGLRILEDC